LPLESPATGASAELHQSPPELFPRLADPPHSEPPAVCRNCRGKKGRFYHVSPGFTYGNTIEVAIIRKW